MATTTKHVRRRGAVHLTYAASEQDRSTEYEIATLPDGALACACMAFVFDQRTPKTCKHIGAYRAAHVSFDRQSSVRREPRERITVGAETFTFRRAISFGAVPVAKGGR